MGNFSGDRFPQLYCHAPVILVICPEDKAICLDAVLADQNGPEHRSDSKTSHGERARPLESRDVIKNGMVFRLTIECTHELGQDREFENLFTSVIPCHRQAVGITIGAHLIGGKHMAPVNKALLSIARSIGRQLGATGIIWCPAKLHVEFAHFSEAVDHYETGSIFPTIIQIALLEPGNGRFETRGLAYFTGTEIRLLFPGQQDSQAWMAHFLHIVSILIARGILTREATLLNNAPHGAQLNSYQCDGSVVEISYTEPIPANIANARSQAALGAASRTF